RFRRSADIRFLQSQRSWRAEALYSQSMERVVWTDERLDDLSKRMDAGFLRVEGDIRDLRDEMRGHRGETHGLRGEMHTGFAELRAEINGLRSLMFRMNAGIIAGVVASALLHGF
ncbi:MAG: hypothetical protein ACOYD4_10100, partial [Solirubrobacterales bacterium]